MGISSWLLKKLYTPKVIPSRKDKTDYLRRYKLIKLFGFGIYIHEILQSDDDKYLHCHPFSFLTVVLKGGYFEILPGKDNFWRYRVRYCPRGTIIYHKAPDAHKLDLFRIPTWTLFIRGPKYREWGFHTDKGWVSHKEYLKSDDGEMD